MFELARKQSAAVIENNAQPDVIGANRGSQAIAETHATFNRRTVPCAAAKDFQISGAAGSPGAAVSGRALIAVVPVVLTPFPDIAVHIIKSEGVRIAQAACSDGLGPILTVG